MIRIQHLTKSVGVDRIQILKGISLDVQRGEMIAVVGASGSGKSMLLRCLALKEKWDGGTFVIDGQDVLKQALAGKRKIRREWAYLEQNPQLYPKRSGLKNVLIGQASQTPIWRMVTGMVRSDDYMGAMDAIEHLGLLEKAHMKAETLSGGEKQRIAIARALVHGAQVILADEPVIGLDPKSAESVLETLKKLCEEERITVITVLPIELAEKYASRIVALSEGKVILDIRGRRLTMRERNMM